MFRLDDNGAYWLTVGYLHVVNRFINAMITHFYSIGSYRHEAKTTPNIKRLTLALPITEVSGRTGEPKLHEDTVRIWTITSERT
jgi:hypothetical protein